MTVKIAPSILSADFSRLAEDIAKVEKAADMLHVDVMDGHFAPNITIGVPVVKSLNSIAKLPIDVHLMIEHPGAFVEPFAKAGSDIITVHVEAINDASVFDKIHELGAKAGVSLNPDTPVEKAEPYLDKVELVLVMSVFPGFSGQKFIDVTQKIKDLRPRYKGEIEVDGGITVENAGKVIVAGADILVSGSFVFKSSDPAKAIQDLKDCGK